MRSHDRSIETIHEGDALRILSLLDERPRMATAMASTDCKLAIIDRKKFRYMVEAMLHFVWHVMGKLALASENDVRRRAGLPRPPSAMRGLAGAYRSIPSDCRRYGVLTSQRALQRIAV